jgi:hypothetical protein
MEANKKEWKPTNWNGRQRNDGTRDRCSVQRIYLQQYSDFFLDDGGEPPTAEALGVSQEEVYYAKNIKVHIINNSKILKMMGPGTFSLQLSPGVAKSICYI